MDVSVKSSLCSPKKCPLNLVVDPTSVTLTATGRPTFVMSPFEVELPRITGVLPKPRVDLPDPEFEATLYTIVPYIETPVGDWRRMPAARDKSGADATRLNSFGVGVGFEARADLGVLNVQLGTFEVNLGKVRMHGVPVQGNDQPFTAGVDLDALTTRVELSEIDVKFHGCVVLNGAEEYCEEEDKESQRSTVAKRRA
jgi:hypothetical protein